MPTSNGRINLAYSKSVKGPWQETVILPYDADGDASAWNCENNNPTATIRPDGSIFLVYRADPCKASAGGGAGGGESLGIATAKHWKGPYVRRAGGPIVSPANKTGDHEDPFLFTDPRGHFHLITHNQGADNICGNRSDHGCGAHLFSRTGEAGSWRVGRGPVYDVGVTLANGSRATLATRQRPQIVFSDSGEPEVLLNGASFEGNSSCPSHHPLPLALPGPVAEATAALWCADDDMADLTHTFTFAFRRKDSAGSGGDVSS